MRISQLIILGFAVLIVFVSGCTNSYDSCKEDCKEICVNKAMKNLSASVTVLEGLETQFRSVQPCDDYCYDECRLRID